MTLSIPRVCHSFQECNLEKLEVLGARRGRRGVLGTR